MKILYLHGWHSVPYGVKPSFLLQQGLDVIQPALPDDDFDLAVRLAQGEFTNHGPDLVIGSSRGGAVAMNMDAGAIPLILLCPAWKRWGDASSVKPGTRILHALADDVIPYDDTLELLRNSGLNETSLLTVGNDHRLADDESLRALLQAVRQAAA